VPACVRSLLHPCRQHTCSLLIMWHPLAIGQLTLILCPDQRTTRPHPELCTAVHTPAMPPLLPAGEKVRWTETANSLANAYINLTGGCCTLEQVYHTLSSNL
jgi:hypothetical protein